MVFLKSLTFILWNVALGWVFLYLIKWFLFNPKPRFFFRSKIPFTPGFIVRKREWAFGYVRDLLHNYIQQAESHNHKDGYIIRWERQVYNFAYDKLKFINRWKLIPLSIREKIRSLLSNLAREIAKNFLRSVVPHLIEKFRLEFYIDKLDVQLGIEIIYYYFKRYIYKPLWYIFLIINALIGINNLIWYLIIA
ncbi:MAG: hypothetical protein PHI68_03600 [Candidatus Cloacimonetes bacterium]|nr:hypothetical protein [Candidatus Cloacimonadota bacterium]